MSDLTTLQVHGVVFLDAGVAPSTPTGELMLSIMSSFADVERKRIPEHLADSRAVRARLGK